MAAGRRFPLVFLDAYVGTTIAVLIAHWELEPMIGVWQWQLLLTFILGFPWLLAATLFLENVRWQKQKKIMAHVVIPILLSVHFLTLQYFAQNSLLIETKYLYIFALLTFTGVMAVFCAPFARAASVRDYWEYALTIFRRICLSAIYMAILFIGLVLAIFSVSYLFSLPELVNQQFIPQVWMVVTGILGVSYFLAGVPHDKREYYHETNKKAPIVLLEYILAPLLALYTVILYIYAATILVDWDWPKGGVVYWILTFSLVGLGAYVLSYSLRDEKPHGLLNRFFSWWLGLLLPLLIVYFIAIGLRIEQYGITENRYIVVALGLWLLVMVPYFLFGRTKHFQVLPLSLGVLALLSLVGPWSMFSLSTYSQVGRLERLLTEQGILINGKIQKAENAPSPEISGHIHSIVNYLVQMDRIEHLQPWFDASLGELVVAARRPGQGYMDRWSIVSTIDEKMGVTNYGGYYPGHDRTSFFSDSRGYYDTPLKVQGYDYLIALHTGDNRPTALDTGTQLSVDIKEQTIRITIGDQSATIDLAPKIQELVNSYGMSRTSIPHEKMQVTFEDNRMTMLLIMDMIDVSKDGRGKVDGILNVNGQLLLKIK